MEVGELASEENGESEEATIGEEAEEREGATGVPEGDAGEGGSDEADPDEAAEEIDADEEEETIEEIHADGVGERSAGEDGIFWPKRDAAGEIFYVSDVEREITEVIGGEDFDGVFVGENEPEKNPGGDEGEAGDGQPFPRVWRGGNGGGMSRDPEVSDGDESTESKGGGGDEGVQATLDEGEKNREEGGGGGGVKESEGEVHEVGKLGERVELIWGIFGVGEVGLEFR